MTVQMLTYRCPHCKQPVEADPHEDGQLMVCPHAGCGRPFRVEVPTAQPIAAMNTVPAPASAASNGATNGKHQQMAPLGGAATRTDSAGVAPESVATPPTASTAAVARAETELKTIRPVMFRRYPFRFLGYTTLIIGGVVAALIALYHDYRWLALLAAVAAGFGAFRLGRWWLRNRNTTLTITQDRAILRTGIVNAVATEIPLAEVKDIQVNQSLVNRIMQVGDLVLSTTGEAGRTVIVMGVPDPQGVACLLRNQTA